MITEQKQFQIPDLKLNNGVAMPQIGYGMFQLSEPEKCERCVRTALESGYRLFDTAAAYRNEDVLGRVCEDGIHRGLVSRDQLFLETKVWLSDFGREETKTAVQTSLEHLRTDHLDLVLLHQPFGNWKEAWKGLEDLYEAGTVRAIGLSNFSIEKVDDLLSFARVRPQVDQIEMHPFYPEQKLFDQLRKRGIQPQAWGPFCEGMKGIFENPVLQEIGAAHGKSAAQAALRWNVQRGAAVLPKGTTPEHMKENLDIYDFELTPEEMQRISALDVGHSEIIDFNSRATERLLLRLKLGANGLVKS